MPSYPWVLSGFYCLISASFHLTWHVSLSLPPEPWVLWVFSRAQLYRAPLLCHTYIYVYIYIYGFPGYDGWQFHLLWVLDIPFPGFIISTLLLICVCKEIILIFLLAQPFWLVAMTLCRWAASLSLAGNPCYEGPFVTGLVLIPCTVLHYNRRDALTLGCATTRLVLWAGMCTHWACINGRHSSVLFSAPSFSLAYILASRK